MIKYPNKHSLDKFSSLARCPAANTTSKGRGAKDDQYSYFAPARSPWIPGKKCSNVFEKVGYLFVICFSTDT